MNENAMLGVAIGFAGFLAGGLARAYTDFAANGRRMFYLIRRGSTESNYRKLVKERRASVWPLILSSTCIPLGIVIVFGSIIWNNHLRWSASARSRVLTITGATYHSSMDFREAHKAIKKGDVLRIRHFLQSGGDANVTNRLSWTLLMMAALEGNTAIGEELIQRGAQLDMQNKFGDTALSLAAHTGHVGFVELLVRSGASLDGHPFGSSLESFLDWSAQYGTVEPEALAKIRIIVGAKREGV